MPGQPIKLGPFTKGLHNSAGTGEYIDPQELYELVNLEVDTDGSLANRPAIYEFKVTELEVEEYRIIGVYYLTSGTSYLVVTYSKGDDYGVALINSSTGKTEKSQKGFSDFCGCGVQYTDKFYVYPAPGTSDKGGYFDDSPSWTEKDLPGGQASSCVIYNERIFSTPGLKASDHKSRLYFSDIGDPTSFDGTDYIDIQKGNGESLVYVVLLTNNLILFKEHSTHRLYFTSNIKKVQVSVISNTIGVPRHNCAVVYGNNSIYTLHDNSVYEMFNFTYTKISDGLRMEEVNLPDLLDVTPKALTLVKDRIFVRYYNRIYVYSLLSKKWSEWKSKNNFLELYPVDTPEGQIAFGSSINKTGSNKIYTFSNSRKDGIDTKEAFDCSIVTKTYDFELSYKFKVLFWWGMTIATMGDTIAKAISPNAGSGNTWAQLAKYTWQELINKGIRWSSASSVMQETTVSSDIGKYSRKFLKFPKKLRFRQIYFQIETSVKPNDVADASVRIYDMVAFLRDKEHVVDRTTA